MVTENVLVFVYGSLKRGHHLHEYVADQRFIGSAVTASRYVLFDCGDYPAMVEAEDGGIEIFGEVYEVTPERLAVLDEVEGVPQNLYHLQKAYLQEPFARDAVLTYIYQQSTSRLRQIREWPPMP